MRLFSELGCRRTQDRARVAPDPDGADANHLGIAGCLHEHRPGRTTWDFSFDLDHFLTGLNRESRFTKRCFGMPEVARVVVRGWMCLLDNRNETQRHTATDGLIDTPEHGRDRRLRTIDTPDDRFHRPRSSLDLSRTNGCYRSGAGSPSVGIVVRISTMRGHARSRLGEPIDIDQPCEIAWRDDADHPAPVDDQGTATVTGCCQPLNQRAKGLEWGRG